MRNVEPKVNTFVNCINVAKVTLLWMTPSVLNLLIENNSLPTVKSLFIATYITNLIAYSILDIVSFGEPLHPPLVAKLQASFRKVWNWYGPTECSILATFYLCHSYDSHIFIGKPLPNYDAYPIYLYLFY